MIYIRDAGAEDEHGQQVLFAQLHHLMHAASESNRMLFDHIANILATQLHFRDQFVRAVPPRDHMRQFLRLRQLLANLDRHIFSAQCLRFPLKLYECQSALVVVRRQLKRAHTSSVDLL